MIGIKMVNETRTMNRKPQSMNAYGRSLRSTDARPLPTADKGEVFTREERIQNAKDYHEKYHLN